MNSTLYDIPPIKKEVDIFMQKVNNGMEVITGSRRKVTNKDRDRFFKVLDDNSINDLVEQTRIKKLIDIFMFYTLMLNTTKYILCNNTSNGLVSVDFQSNSISELLQIGMPLVIKNTNYLSQEETNELKQLFDGLYVDHRRDNIGFDYIFADYRIYTLSLTRKY